MTYIYHRCKIKLRVLFLGDVRRALVVGMVVEITIVMKKISPVFGGAENPRAARAPMRRETPVRSKPCLHPR